MASWSISSFVSASGKRAKILPRSFYARHTLEVARDLLGKILVVRSPSGTAAARIVETEAYRADDAASHSARGHTPRTSVMFGEPGRAYVYFIYGMYEMLNVVTEPKGCPGAVLIRAAEPLAGEALMRARRPSAGRHELARGPGRLCRAMGIGMSHNGASLRGPDLYVLDDGFAPARIETSPRVGISAATEKHWRYFVAGSRFVSRPAKSQLDGSACAKRRELRARKRGASGKGRAG